MNTEDSVDYFALQERVEELEEKLKDSVEVVRCKECKHYEDGMVGYCWEVDRGVATDFFCAYGERKGGDSE